MREKHSDLLVVTALDEVACKMCFLLFHCKDQIFVCVYFCHIHICFHSFAGLFNFRGSDIAYNPVFYGYALLTLDELYLFVEQSKLPANYEEHFSKNGVTVKLNKYEQMQTVLKELIKKSTGKIWISPTSSYALSALVPEKRLLHEVSPVCVMKSVKNATEVRGLVDCHIRDGIALCKYFAWLEDALNRGEAVDEISGATKLQGFRE